MRFTVFFVRAAVPLSVMAPQCAPAPPAAEARAITMERTPCYGRCPVYSVRITSDGDVRFHGTANVAVRGDTSARVPRAQADSLFRFVDSIGFAGLDTAYTSGSPACATYASDLPSVIVFVEQGSSVKRVTHDYGCMNAPKSLRELHRRIDEAARTQPWIGAR